jgi:hypothetical protein
MNIYTTTSNNYCELEGLHTRADGCCEVINLHVLAIRLIWGESKGMRLVEAKQQALRLK